MGLRSDDAEEFARGYADEAAKADTKTIAARDAEIDYLKPRVAMLEARLVEVNAKYQGEHNRACKLQTRVAELEAALRAILAEEEARDRGDAYTATTVRRSLEAKP